MKKNLTKPFTAIVFFAIICISSKLSAQFELANEEYLPLLKKGTTYVLMKNPGAVENKEAIEIIKAYWTFSKLEFIEPEDVTKHIAPENSFLRLIYFETNPGGRAGSPLYADFFALTCLDQNYFKHKETKAPERTDFVQVASVSIFMPGSLFVDSVKLFYSSYPSVGIYNWGTGLLKNYIQQLNMLLNTGSPKALHTDSANEKELDKVKKQILYIPDYILIKENPMTGKESKLDVNSLLKDFKYKYKLLSVEDLNNKILTDKTPFYYLLYVRSNNDKYFGIINSQTGEVVFSKFIRGLSYNIKSSDIQEFYKVMNSN